MDDRDRAAPVPLPREQPVAQSVADRLLAEALVGEPGDDLLLRLGARQAVELPGVDQNLVGRVGGVRGALGDLLAFGHDDRPDLDPVTLREGVVSLVVSGHRHDRPRAVPHQHVVGDPDRDRLAVDGVDGEPPREDAVLLLLLALDLGACGRATDVVEGLRFVLGAGDECRHVGMLRRQDEEGRSEERVGPGREDGQLLPAPLDAEHDARALRAADPVALHRQHALRPVLQQAHLVQQCVCIVGDPEEPLRQALRLDLGPAALTAAVDDLLVREHGLVDRAPLDRRLLPVGEAALVEAQEQPLGPAVVRGIVRGDLATPVDRPPHPVHLLADRGDVALGDGARMPALLDGGVLGGEAERVVAHRPQHLHALAAAQVRDHVADRVVQRMPHVEIARRVRQHLDHVRLAPIPAQLGGIGIRDVERLLVGPDLLPFRLDRLWVVAFHRLRRRSSRGTKKPLTGEAQGRSPRLPPHSPSVT